MKRLGHPGGLHKTLIVVRRISTGSIAVLSASIAMNPERLEPTSPLLAKLATVSDDWAWLGILLCWCTTGGCAWLLRVVGDPMIYAVLNEVLNRFRHGVFGDDGDYAHHRITLFKHRRVRPLGFDFRGNGWPLSGWLVPVARSGHTAQKTSTVFLAPDDTDRARGIAGRAWAATQYVAATALPDVQNGATPDDIRQYATQTNVTERWVEKRRPGTRSLMGFMVETLDGTPWGVLVVDSRNPDLNLAKARIQYRHHARVISRLVEGL